MRTVHPIPITLDKPRTFLLDLRAMARAEQALAKYWGEKRISLIKIFQAGDMGVTELTHLLWAGLLHEEPTLTYDGALALLAKVDLEELSQVITDAIKEQLGLEQPTQGQAADPLPPGTLPNGTGSSSGPQPGTTSA